MTALCRSVMHFHPPETFLFITLMLLFSGFHPRFGHHENPFTVADWLHLLMGYKAAPSAQLQ